MAPYWELTTAIVAGRDAIVDQGDKRLPKFNHESQEDYDFRLKTARFTNIYRDIVEGLAQKPFAHELRLEDADKNERFGNLIEDIDGRGNHLHVFAGETFFNGINKAIEWILVDYTASEGLRTIADEQKAGVRPYWVHIAAVVEGPTNMTLYADGVDVGGDYSGTGILSMAHNSEEDRMVGMVDHKRESERLISDMRASLTPREEKVLNMRFGLDGDVSGLPTVTQERIREVRDKALRKLRERADRPSIDDVLHEDE